MKGICVQIDKKSSMYTFDYQSEEKGIAMELIDNKIFAPTAVMRVAQLIRQINRIPVRILKNEKFQKVSNRLRLIKVNILTTSSSDRNHLIWCSPKQKSCNEYPCQWICITVEMCTIYLLEFNGNLIGAWLCKTFHIQLGQCQLVTPDDHIIPYMNKLA